MMGKQSVAALKSQLRPGASSAGEWVLEVMGSQGRGDPTNHLPFALSVAM